jgi:tRNA (cmo5U34)-methyltransferase
MTDQSVDQLVPRGAWVFDDDVSDVLDNMLPRSIPQYDAMRQLVGEIASPFVRDDTWIVDLGCGRGDALAAFVERFGPRVSYLGVDVAEAMMTGAADRFGTTIGAPARPGVPEIAFMDLREQVPARPTSVALMVLSLQFTPIEWRQRILRRTWETMLPGGALVLVEKLLGATADLDRLMVDVYYGRKRAAGYTAEQIDQKRRSLEGVLVPMTASWNEDLLRQTGFTEVDMFWRWCNFGGWVAVKHG